MNTLPVLRKNAYLNILIKDNYIFANLAYTDPLAQRTYILTDRCDLSPLKFRLDDFVFSTSFWYEYFNSLEKIFDWDIVDRRWDNIFKIKEFEREEIGVTGIKILVDDNQPFFKNIFFSLKEFSKDFVLRVLDDRYMDGVVTGLVDRLGYDDVVWLDLDFSHFSIFRGKKEIVGKDGESRVQFTSSKIDWSNEIGLIDFVRNSKLKAFLSTDISSEDLTNRWANCIAHGHEFVSDPVLLDIIRSFTTLQILSIKQESREKFQNLAKGNTAIFLSGKIPNLLQFRELLLSLIDGLELEGMFDIFLDSNCKVLTYTKSIVEREKSEDIVLFKGDILPKVHRLVIPDISSKSINKVILSGKIYSQVLEPKDIYSVGSQISVIKIPQRDEKVLIEAELRNGAVFSHIVNQNITFMSEKGSLEYESLIVDGRKRPIVYGPSSNENITKFRVWSNGDKG